MAGAHEDSLVSKSLCSYCLCPQCMERGGQRGPVVLESPQGILLALAECWCALAWGCRGRWQTPWGSLLGSSPGFGVGWKWGSHGHQQVSALSFRGTAGGLPA